MSGGRGSGKTRTGSEVTHQVTEHASRIALIGATGPDLRDTMVEGVSGILATSPPGQRPLWEPSKKKLTWPNGCIGQGFSAEEPDRLRGPQEGFIWGDEPAHWPLVEEVWTNALLGLRLGTHPKAVLTSTPKPIKWMKELIKDPLTVVHRVSTYENLDNLADTFRATVLERYEGTRLGRQELHGEILEDVEGALWNWDMIHWVPEPPTLVRIVVGVDPAGTANAKSDETGIITVGIGADKCLYVLADDTGKYSPETWGRKANAAYETFSADAIVPEKNFGADMVRFVLENAGYAGARIIPVNSRRGKADPGRTDRRPVREAAGLPRRQAGRPGRTGRRVDHLGARRRRLPEPGRRPRPRRHRTRQADHARPDRRPHHPGPQAASRLLNRPNFPKPERFCGQNHASFRVRLDRCHPSSASCPSPAPPGSWSGTSSRPSNGSGNARSPGWATSGASCSPASSASPPT